MPKDPRITQETVQLLFKAYVSAVAERYRFNSRLANNVISKIMGNKHKNFVIDYYCIKERLAQKVQ